MPRPLLLAGLTIAALSAGAIAMAQSLEDRRTALQALNGREASLAVRSGDNRNRLAHLLGALQLFSRDAPPALLVSPGDAKNAVRAMILARAIEPQLEARARDLARQTQALALVRRPAAQASGDLFAADSAAQDRQGRLQGLSQDAADLAPPEVRQAASGLDAQPAPAHLWRPVSGTVITRFGGKLVTGERAEGLAFRTAPGASVTAPAAGVIAYAGPLNGWGQVVILRAGGGCHMVLSGLESVLVTAGQSVAAGAPLGSMPANGRAPAQLYFEVRLAGGPIDPARLLNATPARQR